MTREDQRFAALALDAAREAHRAELRAALVVERCTCPECGPQCPWCYGTEELPVECAHPCESAPPPSDEDDPEADTLAWMPDAWREEHTRRVVDTAFCGKERAA